MWWCIKWTIILPDEERFMDYNGMPDVLEYMVIKHVKAYNVEHVYKVSWVKITDGTFISMVGHPLKNLGEIFFHELLPICFVRNMASVCIKTYR